MQFLCFAGQSWSCYTSPLLFIWLDLTWAHFSGPSDLPWDPLDLQMVTAEVWLGNKLPGLPKITRVIVHCQGVLWEASARPNYYNIIVIYMFLMLKGGICASVMGASYTSHTVSQVVVFGCCLSYWILVSNPPNPTIKYLVSDLPNPTIWTIEYWVPIHLIRSFGLLNIGFPFA
jgi:hypothetical protein